jgi:putative ABC transport system permease protein
MVKERAFDLALLRSYGASNFQLIRIITYEGLIIVSFALVLGFLCTKLGLYFILEVLENDFQQISLQTLPFKELFHIIGMVLATTILAVVLAIYPIVKMNISTILSNEK